ncbi:amidohydrolase [Candidatus Binatus sp.]|uniref:amidohydrolase n=1 Tax=Candidatus Binatus sp. TaxID=2811406 RepID=UPI00351D204A
MADTVLQNGRIYTVDPANPWAEALAVRAGKIVFVGADRDVKSLIGSGTRVIDLNRKMVMPGINDVHTHPLLGGRADLFECHFLPTLSLDEVLAVVRADAQKARPGAWIVGGSWGSNFTIKLSTLDALRALDDASAGHPVLLRDDSVHNRWVNSRALELAGIDSRTPDPVGGVIVRDETTGAPVGMLFESAVAIVEQAAQAANPYSLEANVSALTRAIEILNSFGVTGLQDAAVSGAILSAYNNLDADGKLSAWVVGSMMAEPAGFLNDLVGDDLIDQRAKFKSPHVMPTFVKIFLDGVPMSRTSAFIEPYLPDKAHGCCFRGATTKTLPELARLIAKQEDRGLAVKIHCAGDGAVRTALDAFDVVRSFKGATALMHHIAHAGFIDPADVRRFKDLNVVADLSPILWYPNQIIDGIEQAVGDRVRQYWPNRNLIEAGALIATGTDWPVIPNPDPWSGIEGLITRRNPSGQFDGALWPEQALDLPAAIAAYTANPARAMGLESVTGSLSVGKSADMIVLDRNLFEIAPTDIADTRVLTTFFEGRGAYQRD